MAAKVISIQDNSPRFLLSVFNDYQGEIGDLVLAINVVRLALEAEEDNSAPSGTARIALEHLEEMADELEGGVLNLGARTPYASDDGQKAPAVWRYWPQSAAPRLSPV
jgi:hypothetical protein